ncbi:MAG: nucleotidyl transferase AbiEii/AbiGii toxin family protein [Flavobacteriaceae bacterium]|nr:nucleotidyl transferase AbiEii/AbiGii toxin family protein [Flavobacteriaceae bacterium]
MILQKEIAAISEQLGVSKSVIDKDWMLGHFIAAIFNEPELKETLIFKGGTCIKKCWFNDYRFSEDLDFTSKSKEFKLTQNHLKFITNHIEIHTDVKTHLVSIKELLFKDKLAGYEVIIKFWGADHPRNLTPPPPERWQSKIKIEIILFEEMIFEVENRRVSHPYSDNLNRIETIPCYKIEEVLAEKMRALIQRSYTAPRDYYDIWYLSNNFPDLDWTIITDAFYKKMKFKNMEFTGVEQLINPKNDKTLKAAWKNSLGYQIQPERLPNYEIVRENLLGLFEKVFQ